MTASDRLELLRRIVAQHGQSNVARRIGRTPGCLSQILSGTYKADSAIVLELVAAAFGTDTVDCPILGEIVLATCLEERAKPFKATSSQRVRLYRACQTCPHKGGA